MTGTIILIFTTRVRVLMDAKDVRVRTVVNPCLVIGDTNICFAIAMMKKKSLSKNPIPLNLIPELVMIP